MDQRKEKPSKSKIKVPSESKGQASNKKKDS